MSAPSSLPDSSYDETEKCWTRVAAAKARHKDCCSTFYSSESESWRNSSPSEESSDGYNTGSFSNSSGAPSTTASPPTIKTGRGRGRGAQSTATSPPTIITGRGRGLSDRFKIGFSPRAPARELLSPRKAEPFNTSDPYWTVSDLTNSQFYSTARAPKPDELGQIGREIQVIANYFPILQFPHHGLVYRYHIQMRNSKGEELYRALRR